MSGKFSESASDNFFSRKISRRSCSNMTVKRKAEEAFARRGVSSNSGVQIGFSKSGDKLREKADKLLTTRQNLPIWPHAQEIRDTVYQNDVTLLVGETGSGKSTQIPQFLYTEPWCTVQQARSKKIGGRIAIIQPRRVAAVSLASRVASEIGTPLDKSNPASKVGYSVRFDTNVGPNSRIKFLTDGMLLQELLRDPWLREYSCVIVDEVHERGVNVDLILGFLKRILDARLGLGKVTLPDGREGIPLKVMIMSATANMQSIQSFFGIEADFNADTEAEVEEWGGFSDDERSHTNGVVKKQSVKVASCFIKGREYPVRISYTPLAVNNIIDAAMDKIVDLHEHQPLPGDVLVFLSGQEMIENLQSLCLAYAETLNKKDERSNPTKPKIQEQKLPGLQILPLYASLPTDLQQRIFQPTPKFTRRIILSTNIAETSLTVPGVRHVIDTGKHKARLFRPGLNLETLLSQAVSQSMAKQRAGRAGREAAGTCHRLYTEADFWKLEKDTKPEILSTDLNFLVLTLKAHGIDRPLDFPLLTKPPRKSLEGSLEGLLNLGALDMEIGRITEIGRKMAMLPVRADLARVLLEASKYSQDILEGVIDIVAALSLEEGIFLPTGGNQRKQQVITKKDKQELFLNKKSSRNGINGNADFENGDHDSDSDVSDPIESARRELLSRHSDHLTLLNAVSKYNSSEGSDKRAWCDKYKISYRAMRRITEIRKQLSQMMQNKKYRLSAGSDMDKTLGSDPESVLGDKQRRDSILKCLTVGSWQNVALLSSLAPVEDVQTKLNPNQRLEYTTLLTKQPIAIHPSSPAFKRSGGFGTTSSKEDGSKKKTKWTSTLPPCVIFTDLIYTSKPYARNISAIELSWLADTGRIA